MILSGMRLRTRDDLARTRHDRSGLDTQLVACHTLGVNTFAALR
jgi:hypothetical protein